jgi:hypothetical protein
VNATVNAIAATDAAAAARATTKIVLVRVMRLGRRNAAAGSPLRSTAQQPRPEAGHRRNQGHRHREHLRQSTIPSRSIIPAPPHGRCGRLGLDYPSRKEVRRPVSMTVSAPPGVG